MQGTEMINESFLTYKKIRGDDVAIYINPTSKEMRDLVKDDSNKSIRLGITNSYKLYAWPASLAIHFDIEDSLQLDFMYKLEYSRKNDVIYISNLESALSNNTVYQIIDRIHDVFSTSDIRSSKDKVDTITDTIKNSVSLYFELFDICESIDEGHKSLNKVLAGRRAYRRNKAKISARWNAKRNPEFKQHGDVDGS